MIASHSALSPDGSVGRLLTARGGGQRRLRRRRVTQRLLVGDKVVGQLRRVCSDLGLRAVAVGAASGEVVSSTGLARTVGGAATVVAGGGGDGALCVQPGSAQMPAARTINAYRRQVTLPKRCPLTVLASVGFPNPVAGRDNSCQVCRIGQPPAGDPHGNHSCVTNSEYRASRAGAHLLDQFRADSP